MDNGPADETVTMRRDMAGTYLMGYASNHLGFSRDVVLLVGVAGGICVMAISSLSARLSDRIGRRKVMLLGYAVALPWSFVLFPLIDTGHETILDALQISDVAESADRLIELALRGGGPDNVTVVVADVIDYDYGQTQPILAGAVSGEDDQVAPPDTAAGRASAFNPRRNEAKRVVPQPEELPPPKRSRRRLFIAAALLVLVVVAALGIGRWIIRNNYYVTQNDGTVSIMRGVQGSFLGIQLQEPYLLGCLNERNDLSLISAGQAHNDLDCRMLGVDDMTRPRPATSTRWESLATKRFRVSARSPATAR